MGKYKLFDSIKTALQAGCAKENLTEKNGVVYCEVQQKEYKVDRTTKEYKVEGTKTTKSDSNIKTK